MKNIRTPLLLGLVSVATLMLAAPLTAQAHVRWSVNIGIGAGGFYPSVGAYYHMPRVYYPAPAIVYRPAPVYVPAYVEPAVIYQESPVIYDRPVRHVAPPRYYETAPVAPSGYGYRRGYREYRDYRR